MNPVPTDAQWLLLYMIEDGGEVRSDGAGGWRADGPVGTFRCTGMVQRLWQLGLVDIVGPVDEPHVCVNAEGLEVLKRRSVYDVLERRNRKAR